MNLSNCDFEQEDKNIPSTNTIPNGKYLAVVESCQMKPTKDGLGKYIETVFQIIDSPVDGVKNRKLWDRYNWENKSEIAVQMGKAKFLSLRKAINVLTPKDTSDLHQKVLCLELSNKKNNDGEMETVVKSYLPEKEYGPAKPVNGNGPGSKAGWMAKS